MSNEISMLESKGMRILNNVWQHMLNTAFQVLFADIYSTSKEYAGAKSKLVVSYFSVVI